MYFIHLIHICFYDTIWLLKDEFKGQYFKFVNIDKKEQPDTRIGSAKLTEHSYLGIETSPTLLKEYYDYKENTYIFNEHLSLNSNVQKFEDIIA